MDSYDAWLLTEAEKCECEICKARYHYERIHVLELSNYMYLCESCFDIWLNVNDEIEDVL